jgi:hypothetical protein
MPDVDPIELSEITQLVARAVELSKNAGFFQTYTDWALRWLDASDRSHASAYRARCLAAQWRDFAGPSRLCSALGLTADAAQQLDLVRIDGARRAREARTSALIALDLYRLDVENAPLPDVRPDEPPLVIGERECGPNRYPTPKDRNRNLPRRSRTGERP